MLDLGDDVQRRSIAILQDRQQRTALPVLPHDIALDRKTVPNLSNVAQVDHRSVHLLDRQPVHFSNRIGAGVQPHIIFIRANLRCSRRQHQILRGERRGYVRGRQAPSLHCVRVQIDHDLATTTAIWQRNGRTLHGG